MRLLLHTAVPPYCVPLHFSRGRTTRKKTSENTAINTLSRGAFFEARPGRQSRRESSAHLVNLPLFPSSVALPKSSAAKPGRREASIPSPWNGEWTPCPLLAPPLPPPKQATAGGCAAPLVDPEETMATAVMTSLGARRRRCRPPTAVTLERDVSSKKKKKGTTARRPGGSGRRFVEAARPLACSRVYFR